MIVVTVVLRMEFKEISSKKNTVNCIILEDDISEEWRKDQLADSVISVFLKGKELNRKPLFQDLASLDSSAKIYLPYWDALFLKDGVLYKKWKSPNSKSEILQVVVPYNRINQILITAYDLPSGHFGINKNPRQDPQTFLLGFLQTRCGKLVSVL